MPKAVAKNKDTVLNAAMSLFKETGFDNVSVKDICAAAGVSRSSFYAMFSDKTEILVYSLDSVKEHFELAMPEFIKAPNDFERIWFITDAYLKNAVLAGPDLSRMYFMLELKGKCSLFDILASFNPWLVSLLQNCQGAGIVGNTGEAKELVPIQLNIAKAALFDWIRYGGGFPLEVTVRRQIETFLDVKPQYRAPY